MNQAEIAAELQRNQSNPLKHQVKIEFDGGTPRNIPSRGYGLGYGSYQISSNGQISRIVRRDFGIPMSANVAEISTLIAAIKSARKNYTPSMTILEIHGDSQIALNRCSKPVSDKLRIKSPDFCAAVDELQLLLSEFKSFTTHWRGRAASVRLFGH